MKENIKINLNKIKKLLAPEEEVGAIEINNKVVKGFCFSNDGSLTTKWSAIFPMPMGVINNGIAQSEEMLTKTLVDFRKEINKQKKATPYIILSLPSQNFFTSILSVPKLSKKESMEEAVRLNLRLRSPIPIDNAYVDWEIIDNSDFQNSYTIFAAVGDKINIDKYVNCATKAGFKVLAVEKPALGLLRFIEKFSIDHTQYLLINIDRDGVDLVVSKDNRLAFYDFDSLNEVARYDLNSNLSAKDFQVFLTKKISQVSNFCQSRQNQVLKKFFLFSIIPGIKQDLINLVSTSFNLESLALQNTKLVKISEEWYSVIGTAIRGTIPRSEDTIVSLMEVGTEDDYKNNQIIKFTSMWSKISITIMLSLFMIYFGVSTLFFAEEEARLIQKNSLVNPNQNILKEKIKLLEVNADAFNKSIVGISNVVNKITDWDQQIKFCLDLAKKNKIDVLGVSISNEAGNVTLEGISTSQNAIGNLKTDLEGTRKFSNISVPIETIKTDGQNHYFIIKFNLGNK